KLPLGNCSCIALLTYIHVGILLERVGVRRIKIRKKALFDPLILTFSRWEKGLSSLNLMAVTPERGNDVPFISDSIINLFAPFAFDLSTLVF
ncbi:MAG: hypothetical protein NTY50_09275, partial [Methylobacter sp.]|nr:hypothetical protein [Methylobacter sp.]